jgi:hypothetical protein
MKKHEIKVGGLYLAKVSDKVVPVRITGESPHGGWDAVNEKTGKRVRIKSAQRLRGQAGLTKPEVQAAKAAVGAQVGAGGKPAAPSQAGAPADEKKAKVEAWRKEVAAKVAAPDPAVEKAVADASKARAEKKAKTAKPKGERKGGVLDAAAKVLAEEGHPMQTDAIVQAALKKGLWKTGGKTPGATLYSAMIRHIEKHGKTSRFRRADMKETKDGKVHTLRGYFALVASDPKKEG